MHRLGGSKQGSEKKIYVYIYIFWESSMCYTSDSHWHELFSLYPMTYKLELFCLFCRRGNWGLNDSTCPWVE